MELRKPKTQTLEFTELHAKLNELGLYEKGMDLEQMRQVMAAVDESIKETSFNDQEIEIALRESERDFVSSNIYNSTMIGSSEKSNGGNSSLFGHRDHNSGGFSSPFSSPEIGCVQKITVVAEVHHELNWTPHKSPSSAEKEKKRLARKRTADAISQDDSGVMLSSNSLFETTSV